MKKSDLQQLIREEISKVMKESISKIQYSREDITWDMSLEEIAENVYDSIKSKQSALIKQAQRTGRTYYLSIANVFDTGLEQLGVELTKESFEKSLKVFKELFKKYPATSIAYEEPNVKVLGENRKTSIPK